MKVCGDGHEEIVFDDSGWKAECPACKLLAQMGEQDDEIEALKGRLEESKENLGLANQRLRDADLETVE